MSGVHPTLAGAPLLIAHRGGGGLAPENTLAAFERADRLWRADMIEFDVRRTADGHCVVMHDPTVDRTTNGTGPIAQMTLAQVKALDAGYRFTPDGGRTFPFRDQGVRIPTIEEMFEALPAMRMTIELKTAEAQQPLFKAIDRFGAGERVIAAGERDAYRTEFHKWTGCVSASREIAMPFLIWHKLRLTLFQRMRADVVQTCETLGRTRVVSARLVRELHRRNIQIHVWTVNELADMHRLLDWGVDGMITDYPDRLAAVLHERIGRPLPPGSLTHSAPSGG